MAYAKLENNTVVLKLVTPDLPGMEEIPDNGTCGMIKKNGTFVHPVASQAKLMDMLRKKRDRLLTESDWWASSDLTMSAKRKSYRQALRDLPASASPSLDESGQLTGVTWPTKPA